MRVLVFSQYFPPEIGAGQTRVHSLAAGLAARGHEVEVVCEVPNHPQGVVQAGYGGRLVDRRELDGMRVSYVRVITAAKKTLWTRAAFYGSYVLEAAAVGAIGRRPDVIFASSPPLPVGIPGALAALRYARPWVFDVRDLWPEAAVSMGELSDPRLVGLLDRLARRLYRQAAAVTTTTEPFKRAIVAKGADEAKVKVLPNGTTSLWLDAASLKPDRRLLGLPAEPFLWTYAGMMNFSQNIGTALEAAEILGEGFHLHVVGAGPERPLLEERARQLGKARVSFQSQVPPAEAAEILRASDALLMSLAAKPGLRDSVPSKVYDYAAVGRPVLMAAGGEAGRLSSAARAALPVTPGDPEALAGAVRRMREDPALREELVRNGRAFAEENMRERQVARLEAVLKGAAGERAQRASAG